MRTPGMRSSGPMSRRAAHWVHTVTRPLASTMSSRSWRGAACGRANSAALPGSPYQAASPVSQRETSSPAATPAAATVNAWLQRSAPSPPDVALITNALAISGTVVVTGYGGVLGIDFGAMGGMVNAGVLVLVLAVMATLAVLLVIGLSRIK